MGLSRCTDSSAAEWITGSRVPWPQLVTFGPAGFSAYARLRMIPDPVRPAMEEADADLCANWPGERDLLRATLAVLGRHTGTADSCYFCVWEGWPQADLAAETGAGGGPGLAEGPEVHVPPRRPARSYFLLRGTLADYLDPDGAWPTLPSPVEPAFVWPADQAWCVAFDVDPHYAGIGASAAAIDELLVQPGLDVVRADPEAPQPRYG